MKRVGGVRTERVQDPTRHAVCRERAAHDWVAGHHGRPADLAGDPGCGKVALACPGAGRALPAVAIPRAARKQQSDHGRGDEGNNRYQQAREAVAPPGPFLFPARRPRHWRVDRPVARRGSGRRGRTGTGR